MSFIDLPERSPEWHAHRLKFIGGSEIPSLFGAEEQPEPDEEYEEMDIRAGFHDSVFALHYIKSGAAKPRPVEAEIVDAGIYMESSIARLAADKRGWKLIKGRYAVDDTTPGMGASLDYEIQDAGEDTKGAAVGGPVLRGIRGPLIGPGSFQIKNVREGTFAKKWTNHEPPLYVILQLQHELACSGYKWGVVGAWVGGNRLRLYFYDAHPEIIASIRERVTEFWARIRDGKPPAIDGSDSSSYVLRQLFPKLHDSEAHPVDLSGNNEIPLLCAELTDFRDQRLYYEKEEKDRKNRIEEILGGYTHGRSGDWRVSVSVTPENPGRPGTPADIIGKRKEVRRLTVSNKPPSSKKAKK
jgi:hypothetical protein